MSMALGVSLLLCAYFVVVSDASDRAKLVVAALFLASLAMTYWLRGWGLAGLLLQVALAIGVLMHMKVTSRN